MGWPGRAQRLRARAEQDGEASKLKELTMHTHQKSSDPVAMIVVAVHESALPGKTSALPKIRRLSGGRGDALGTGRARRFHARV
jgi:hypothetical protein